MVNTFIFMYMYLEDHLVHISCVVMGFLPAAEEECSLIPAVADSLMTESQSLVAVEMVDTFLGVTKESEGRGGFHYTLQ